MERQNRDYHNASDSLKRMQEDPVFGSSSICEIVLLRLFAEAITQSMGHLRCWAHAAELRDHLESQFAHGMNWDNYGQWHVDHIRPDLIFQTPTAKARIFNHYGRRTILLNLPSCIEWTNTAKQRCALCGHLALGMTMHPATSSVKVNHPTKTPLLSQ